MTSSLPGFDRFQQRTDAPEAPDARILALDVGLYGHVGSLASFFWYRAGGVLHAHQASLFEPDDNLLDQLTVLEAWAEAYPEYRYLAPAVIVGTTVLSPVGRRAVRDSLDRWYSPPHRRRLLNIGDYAGEQAATTGVTSRKKMRDLVGLQMARNRLTLTDDQRSAITLYTGKRAKPGRDPDEDGWRVDETDAVALPVAHACFAAQYLLPPPVEGPDQLEDRIARYARAWQLDYGLSDTAAHEHAWQQGHPHQRARSQQNEPVMRRAPGHLSSRPLRGGRS